MLQRFRKECQVMKALREYSAGMGSFCANILVLLQAGILEVDMEDDRALPAPRPDSAGDAEDAAASLSKASRRGTMFADFVHVITAFHVSTHWHRAPGCQDVQIF